MMRLTVPIPIKFLIVGATNTVFGLLAIYVLKWFDAADAAANAVGYSVGLIVSFSLNRRWTFKHSGAALPAALRFLLVFGVAYLANLSAVLSAIKFAHLNGYIAQVLGVPCYMILFYLGSRYFAFRWDKAISFDMRDSAYVSTRRYEDQAGVLNSGQRTGRNQ